MCARYALFVVGLAVSAAGAADWPQWQGPTRDNIWTETGIVDVLPEGGPKKLWTKPIEGGYAGPAVAGGKVYVTDRVLTTGAKNPDNPFDTDTAVNGSERILCLDAKTGTQLWKHEYPCDYKVSYGCGPRCTPTVADGQVYALGAMGDLVCLDAKTGELVWKKDFKKDYAAKTPIWGFCGHPLVYQKLLICLVGGEKAHVVAFDKGTGKEVWKALSPAAAGKTGYAPPALAKAGGEDVVIQFLPTEVAGLDPLTGNKLWGVPVKQPTYAMSIMTPRLVGKTIYAGGNEAAIAFTLDGTKTAVAWEGDMKKDGKERGLYPVNMTPFVDGNVIYGVDQPGMMRAVELATGKRLWYAFEPVVEAVQDETFKGAGSGTAFLVKHDDRFFIFNEKGSLIIAKLSPQGYQEISKAKLVEPTGAAFGRKVVWSAPAFAEKCIFVRNDTEIACFSLAK